MKFWETVRNIGALIGAIWVIIQLINYVTKEQYAIEAIVDKSEFVLPQDFKNLLSLENPNNIYEKIDQTSRKYNDTSLKIYAETYLNNSFIKNFKYSTGFSDFTRIKIKNLGQKEVSNLTVNVNKHEVMYQFTNSEGKLINGESENRIAIGSLLPNENIELFLWHRSSFLDDINITFPDGVANIYNSKKLHGFGASVGELFEDNFYLFFVILILFLLIVLFTITFENGMKAGMKRANASVEDKENKNNITLNTIEPTSN